MSDSDIDSLSADGAQDTERMTDPRAALAEHQKEHEQDRCWCPCFRDAKRLAAAGYVIVNRYSLAAAISIAHPKMLAENALREADAIFAALSPDSDHD